MKNTGTTSVGICLGASTLSLVELQDTGSARKVTTTTTRPHLGNVRSCLLEILGQKNYPLSTKLAVTGRKLRHALSLSSIAEPLAVELAIRQILPPGHPYRSVVSAGGETFILYHLDDTGCIQEIQTGNKCASGTGEFFVQQLRRMDLTLDTASTLTLSASPHKVSGRCSVFCKSDCTHAINKGVAKAAVVGGLGRMMADKIDELFGKLERKNVILIGGCTQLTGMVRYLHEKVSNLLIPEEAVCFEALGAACWALDHDTLPLPTDLNHLFQGDIQHFSCHPPLKDFARCIHFKSRHQVAAGEGDHALLGLDVGSTTTKGVVMRRSDKAVLASAYLRTGGDPIAAAQRVYSALHQGLPKDIHIDGLGVTGSGRQIAGRHAMASGVVNEIIAHATAAAFYDPEVDTIFEIGGQDAKYTFLVNGVPQDYAMNEACSAGTGSFLEESAKESLGLAVEDIGDIAYGGNKPPNFSDQCAAFIGSDIKNAVQQNINTENIVAGLVYSVCQNYINRVVGNRPVGRKIFVQGGVCYNRAVPAALAALTGREVVVPPEPGLMGAFGVALEIDKRLDQGLLQPAVFDLAVLAARGVSPLESFICTGGKDRCDNRCEISLVEIDGTKFPFGGICNRYDNLTRRGKTDGTGFSLVATRQGLIFAEDKTMPEKSPTVGMNRSFLVNTYHPFYRTFFAGLGYRLVLPDRIDPQGIAQRGASFCYPAEIAHGYLAGLMAQPTDYTFLPHFKGLPAEGHEVACTCVFVQSEPYYLRSAFPELNTRKALSPVIDFSRDVKQTRKTFEDIATELGRSRNEGRRAFDHALKVQEDLHSRLQELGRTFLHDLESKPEETAVVLFGRPYSAFAKEANKGIPLKFAARGMRIIPFDMLPFASEALPEDSNMYWGTGNSLMKCARLVTGHPQLFGVFISNFSCGPDSFIITYLREIMEEKPSLTLELDSHTADAGIETRIEAFLDIIASHRNHRKTCRPVGRISSFVPATMQYIKSRPYIKSSAGELVPLTDQRVRLVVPSMGKFSSTLLAKSFTGSGIRAEMLQPADARVLKLGKEHSTCKECLPLQTTVGSILNYLQNHRPDGELTVYFMPSAPGPCRFGQYNVFTKHLIEDCQLKDIVVFSPHSENCYGGLTGQTAFAALRAVVIGDLFDEMWATVLTGAAEQDKALDILDSSYRKILDCIDQKWSIIAARLKECAADLSRICLTRPYGQIPKISLIGEIYVRHDPISLQQLVEKMAKRGFIVRTSQTSEWLKYLDWLIKNGILGRRTPAFWLKHFIKERTDSAIRKLLAPAGLFFSSDLQIESIVQAGSRYISPHLQGETILTVGSAFHDILNPACGVISLGPFGCMPNRVAEAILKEKFSAGEKRALMNGRKLPLFPENDAYKFPFLAIETDGNPFPQIIEARLEAFCLQAERVHQRYLL